MKNQFPNMEQRKQIAKDLDLTQQHIQVGMMIFCEPCVHHVFKRLIRLETNGLVHG